MTELTRKWVTGIPTAYGVVRTLVGVIVPQVSVVLSSTYFVIVRALLNRNLLGEGG